MISVLQRVQGYCASILPQGPEAGRPAKSPLTLLPSTHPRRVEARRVKRETCTYTLTHAVDPRHVMIEEGCGVIVNTSRSGMQLLLGIAPLSGQLLEVHLGSSLRRSVVLMEVRWTKPVRHDVQAALYAVGCRLTFGPYCSRAF